MHTLPVDTTATDALLQAIPGFVLVVEAGRLTFANRAALNLLGVTAGELAGRPWPASGTVTPDGPPVRLSLATPAGERMTEWHVRTYSPASPGSPAPAPSTLASLLWVGREVTHECPTDADRLLASVGDNMFDAQLLLAVEPDGQYRIRAANRRYLEILRERGFAVSESAACSAVRSVISGA